MSPTKGRHYVTLSLHSTLYLVEEIYFHCLFYSGVRPSTCKCALYMRL